MSDQPGCPCSICDECGREYALRTSTEHASHSHHRWSVAKRGGRWRVIDRGVWAETHDSLAEAHTSATQNAVADRLYEPGGLTLLAQLLNRKARP